MLCSMSLAPTLNPQERLDWLRLIRTENVGPVTFHQLLRALRLGRGGAGRPARAGAARRAAQVRSVAREAERELAAIEQLGAPADLPGASRTIRRRSPRRGRAAADHRAGPAGIAEAAGSSRWSARATPRPTAAASPASWRGTRRGRHSSSSRAWRAASTRRPMAARSTQGTVAVVAGGVDIVYPAENRGLYDAHRRSRARSSPNCRSAPSRRRAISRAATASSPACRSASSWSRRRPKSGSLITARLAARAGPRGVRRAGLAARPALPRLQRPDPQRRHPDRERRRRSSPSSGRAAGPPAGAPARAARSRGLRSAPRRADRAADAAIGERRRARPARRKAEPDPGCG